MDKIKKIIPKDIIIILILAVVLNSLRIILFKSHSFVWLFWNLFLAIIPFLISSFLWWYFNKNKSKNILIVLGMIIWLLFIPNAFYIVTDLMHIGVVRSVPVLYDALLLFSMAWVGLYLGLYSVSHIDQILRKKFSKKITEIIILGITFLISLGVYLGRFLRFNSWDIFKDTGYLLKSVHKTFSGGDNQRVYLYLIILTAFVFLYYKAFIVSKKE